MEEIKRKYKLYKLIIGILCVLLSVALLMLINVSTTFNEFQINYQLKMDKITNELTNIEPSSDDIYNETDINKQYTSIQEDYIKLEKRVMELEKIDQTPEPVNYKTTRVISQKINEPSGLTLDEYDTIINITLLDNEINSSQLIGTGSYIFSIEKAFNINGLFLLSVASHSSNYGTSLESIKYNNIFRIPSANSKYVNINESLYAFAKMLKINYIEKDLITIEDISKKYISGKSDKWTMSINGYMTEYVKYVNKLLSTE